MSSITAPKTVLLKGDPIAKEAVANAAITPGHLIERMSTGKVRVHATAGGVAALKAFAREEEYVGGSLDVAYAANDQVPFYVCRPGDEVYALVAAAAPAIVVGDKLESAGDGTLRKVVSYLTDNSGGSANTTLQDIGAAHVEAEVANNFADVAAAINALKPSAVAIALEDVDNSGGGAAVRIRVEIL